MRRPWMLIPLILFLGLAGLFLKTLYDKKNLQDLAIDPSALPSALIGKPVPAFALPSLDEPGRTLTEQDFRGEVALVNVWATWCPTCRAEHAMFNKLASQGVTIHGVNYKDNSEAARRWLEELGNPYQLNVEARRAVWASTSAWMAPQDLPDRCRRGHPLQVHRCGG